MIGRGGCGDTSDPPSGSRCRRRDPGKERCRRVAMVTVSLGHGPPYRRAVRLTPESDQQRTRSGCDDHCRHLIYQCPLLYTG